METKAISYIPAWLLADVICISRAICWRSDIGVFADSRPILPEPPVTLGRDVDGIFLLTFWNMMTKKSVQFYCLSKNWEIGRQ